MREVRLAKLTLNMGAGDSAARLEASKKAMKTIAGKTIVVTSTRKRTTFGTPRNKAIGVMVTLRGTEAAAMLKRLLEAIEGKLKPTQFDRTGNFSFGIQEYIHIPGIQYDAEIGILGLDVAVTLERPGYRVKRKRIRTGRVGAHHQITKDEAIAWARQFGFRVEEES
ncbi:MAG: 50S ribosomal protein L5 [Candidatus Aenigmarchaeota archaeon]|nr:50S ribosomal protein L5 [Candidatus Aenigmarchaeota archaeon]